MAPQPIGKTQHSIESTRFCSAWSPSAYPPILYHPPLVPCSSVTQGFVPLLALSVLFPDIESVHIYFSLNGGMFPLLLVR